MPAERSRIIKRSGVDAPQLVWTVPVEPTTIDTDGLISFSSFPSPFDDGPPPLVDPNESILFPPACDAFSPRKPAHSRKKPEDHIPRPPNAFILFRSSFIKGQHVPTEVETNHSTLSKIIGLTWKNLPNDERLFWHAKAKAALDEHKRKFPQYAFRPTQTRNKGAGDKRKVREVGFKDHKRCAKIAELLVEGKKGQELDEAVQEFDKHHVPEVVTRFEAPITAHMYRRSSSAPIPDDDEKQKRRKCRSTSSQPTSPFTAYSSSMSLPETKLETQSVESFLSAFDQYPLSASSSPSFDFNTFSFDAHSSPMSTYQTCDPLSQPTSPLGTSELLLDATHGHSTHLSIDTSFLGMDDWNCPSPLSADSSMPATPSFIGTSPSDLFGSFPVQTFEDKLAKSFSNNNGSNNSAGLFSAYPDSSSSSGNCDAQFLGAFDTDAASVYSTFAQNSCSQVHMANQDHDFSALMASIPGYAI